MFSKMGLRASVAVFAAASIMNIVSVGPAQAASNLCTSRTAMVTALSQKYHEERRGIGIASRAGVMEFYVSPKGTWTMVMTMPNGTSCIMAAGRDWEEIEATPAGINS